MTNPDVILKMFAESVVQEASTVVNTLKEKGRKRFGRTLVLTGAMLSASYFLIYRPPQQKSEKLQAQIDRAIVLAGYSDRYTDLRSLLAQAYLGLPSSADREQWLSNSVHDSLLKSGLSPETFMQAKEDEDPAGLIFQSSTVSMELHFSDFYDWLLRIENAKPLMHMQKVSLSKISGRIGFDKSQCDISTVIPLKRYQ